MLRNEFLPQKNNSCINRIARDFSQLKVNSGTFRSVPIIPKKEELLGTTYQPPVLRPIRVKGKYPSVDDYLDLHFHLMREDFINPLRNGIQTLKKENPDFDTSITSLSTSRDIFLYPKARFDNVRCCREGTCFTVVFDKSGMMKCDLENSKRLIYGSFVCFISDDYEISHIGTVVDRSKVADGKISVQLTDNSFSIEKVNKRVFLMIEPRSYFFAYFHVLKRLKSFSEFHFPLLPHVINCLPTLEPPSYLQWNPNLLYNLTCVSLNNNLILTPLRCVSFSGLKVNLDFRQMQAFIHALTRKIALIQGPPGTGKTFIGLKICEVLVNSVVQRINGFGPILVICYTNHALDQFLEGVVSFLPHKVLRVGNQCSSPYLQKYLMHKSRNFYQRNYLLPEYLQWQLEELYAVTTKVKHQMTHLSRCLHTRDEFLIDFSFLRLFVQRLSDERLQNDSDLKSWLCPTANDENMTKENRAKKERDCILRELKSADYTSIEKEREISNIWKLTEAERWCLYRLWLHRFVSWGFGHLEKLSQYYDRICSKLREVKMDCDLEIFREQYVIAMTTSGASRYGHILDKLRPKIVLVEEAAEVLESHLISSLTSGCEHLILIGDHQQLRPNPATYEFKKKYRLDLSLFERLINNGFPYDTLTEQRRMRTEISDLVRYIYPGLKDHISVNERGNILGLTTNTYLISHNEPEKCANQTKSFSNSFEVNYILHLVEHLLFQGYHRKQITVITPYSAQVTLLSDSISYQDLRITTIDNYQGEENDIVILSLVRSNDVGTIGFSGDINRVCVALSRGRKGMYILGNFELFARKSPLWHSVVELMKKKNRFGLELSIKCELHPSDKSIEIKSPDDFKLYAPNGGCQRKCKTLLNCGHQCPNHCHPLDTEHRFTQCVEPCPLFCERELHRCPLRCGEPCDPCMVETKTSIPHLNFEITSSCYDDPNEWSEEQILEFKRDNEKPRVN